MQFLCYPTICLSICTFYACDLYAPSFRRETCPSRRASKCLGNHIHIYNLPYSLETLYFDPIAFSSENKGQALFRVTQHNNFHCSKFNIRRIIMFDDLNIQKSIEQLFSGYSFWLGCSIGVYRGRLKSTFSKLYSRLCLCVILSALTIFYC